MLRDENAFTNDEKSALVDVLFGMNDLGNFSFNRMIRWESEVKCVVLSDDDGIGTSYIKKFVGEIGSATRLNISHNSTKGNLIFAFAKDHIAEAQKNRNLFSKFFVGDGEEDRRNRADACIEEFAKDDVDGFSQFAVPSFEHGVIGSMTFIKSGDNSRVARNVAFQSIKALGLYGNAPETVRSILARDPLVTWPTDFDYRAIDFVYGGALQSGADMTQVRTALGIESQ